MSSLRIRRSGLSETFHSDCGRARRMRRLVPDLFTKRERFQITRPMYSSLRSISRIPVGHQVENCFPFLGRGGGTLSAFKVQAIFLSEIPLADISNILRTMAASTSFTMRRLELPSPTETVE